MESFEHNDWGETTQQPGPDGVVAHTPDPKKYHQGAHGTIIPRAKPGKQQFMSHSFGEIPLLNIDPTDPVTGQGGLTVNLANLTKQELQKASQQGAGDPYTSWTYVAANRSVVAELPKSNPTPKEPVMPIPPQPDPLSLYLPEERPTAVDPVQQTTLHLLQTMIQSLQELKQPVIASTPVPAYQQVSPTIPAPAPAPAPAQDAREAAGSPLAVPADTGLDFLTDPPSPPKVHVIFDLGKGGRHFKRFHHVAVHGSCLSMIYDTRYEGDQFIPPATEGDQDPPITITFPQKGQRSVQALVPKNYNQRLGCLDLLNFVIFNEQEPLVSNTDDLAESLR